MGKRIQRRRSAGWRMPPDTIYCGRPSDYGNPFSVGDTLKTTATKYPTGYFQGEFEIDERNCLIFFEEYARQRLRREPNWLEPLRDKDLACWCSLIRRCHVDIILLLLAEKYATTNRA